MKLNNSNRIIRFIDLFAGMGGLRLGFEAASEKHGLKTECVLTSEIKPFALKVLRQNFPQHNIVGDISEVDEKKIPDFDFLLGGFPCQPFSSGGKRHGFVDTRGTLFFEIERILRHKKPYGFLLENVDGLVKHDLENKNDIIGRTFATIIERLESMNYKVSWDVLDARDFGLPQTRKRVYIVGALNEKVELNGFETKRAKIKDILEDGLPILNTRFTELLLKHFQIEDLYGKSIKDKRGGGNNIHSWEIGIKGQISTEQTLLLNKLLKERRRKKWAFEIGIDWMDGMPLTVEQISTFHKSKDLKKMLDDLVDKGYLKSKHPKALVIEESKLGTKKVRKEDESLPKGYNIVTGKLSFQINKILNPEDVAPTLTATDMDRIVVPQNNGLRKMSLREGMRLFGYPDWFEMPVKESEAYDLLGNTVAVPVVENVTKRLIYTL